MTETDEHRRMLRATEILRIAKTLVSSIEDIIHTYETGGEDNDVACDCPVCSFYILSLKQVLDEMKKMEADIIQKAHKWDDRQIDIAGTTAQTLATMLLHHMSVCQNMLVRSHDAYRAIGEASIGNFLLDEGNREAAKKVIADIFRESGIAVKNVEFHGLDIKGDPSKMN